MITDYSFRSCSVNPRVIEQTGCCTNSDEQYGPGTPGNSQPCTKGTTSPFIMCSTSAGPTLVQDTSVLENVHRCFTKIIPGLTEPAYQERLQSLNLCSLCLGHSRGSPMIVFKLPRDLTRRAAALFTTKETPFLRWHSPNLKMPRALRKIRSQICSHGGVKKRNKLPKKQYLASFFRSLRTRHGLRCSPTLTCTVFSLNQTFHSLRSKPFLRTSLSHLSSVSRSLPVLAVKSYSSSLFLSCLYCVLAFKPSATHRLPFRKSS